MNKKYMSRDLVVKEISEDGVFSGYASVFDVKDHARDIVLKGAFAGTIAKLKESGKSIPILWQHDSKKPIGKFTSIEEDDYGLAVTGKLVLGVEQAREAHALLMEKVVDGLSIGYYIKEGGVKFDAEKEAWLLGDLELIETSIVTFPCNESATISDVKTLLAAGTLPTLKEFEKSLRELGFSRTQATAIASHGLSKLIKEEQGEPDNDLELKKISEELESMKGLLS